MKVHDMLLSKRIPVTVPEAYIIEETHKKLPKDNILEEFSLPRRDDSQNSPRTNCDKQDAGLVIIIDF